MSLRTLLRMFLSEDRVVSAGLVVSDRGGVVWFTGLTGFGWADSVRAAKSAANNRGYCLKCVDFYTIKLAGN